ncbi:MAG: hypothetical protein UX89_C0024G0005 [Parcubacteria group bacterium GW2011_GWA2_47_16]|nr:MAG: hypothetical protein UX89_C0024G0005 [Parcubacteria group bacterium GW2011_GWA2_47_16]
MWNVEVRGKARKVFQKIPVKNALAVFDAIEELGDNPFSGDIEKLEGETSAWRRRTGAYRIFYEIYIQTHSVYVYKIERRGSHTY